MYFNLKTIHKTTKKKKWNSFERKTYIRDIIFVIQMITGKLHLLFI